MVAPRALRTRYLILLLIGYIGLSQAQRMEFGHKRPSFQSSTLDGLTADKANDGVSLQTNPGCSSTKTEQSPFW